MEETRISESLRRFYEHNHIDPEFYTADQRAAYEQNKYCDVRIAENILREKVHHWIERFDEEDKEYFLALFEKYNYFSERELKYRFAILCGHIFEQLKLQGIERKEVLFVTVSGKNGTSGGGDSIRNFLLSVNLEWGIYKGQIVSDIASAGDDVLKGRKAVIFVDDIMGTGFTVRETMDCFLKRFPGLDIGRYVWGASGIMVTKSAKRYIKKKAKAVGIDLNVYAREENYIRSCMKGNYIFEAEEVREVESIIKRYEDQIGPDGENGENFSMGFRECKLLLSFYYNTPNDTLCSFWKYAENNLPVFPRDKYIRPTIDALKKKKECRRDNAYLKGCVDRDGNA